MALDIAPSAGPGARATAWITRGDRDAGARRHNWASALAMRRPSLAGLGLTLTSSKTFTAAKTAAAQPGNMPIDPLEAQMQYVLHASSGSCAATPVAMQSASSPGVCAPSVMQQPPPAAKTTAWTSMASHFATTPWPNSWSRTSTATAAVDQQDSDSAR
jgi:hypothetical protein